MLNQEQSPLHHEFLRQLAEHEAAIHTFLRAILPVGSDVDETFQTTMTSLWEKFADYDTSHDFKPWAFGIAKQKALALLQEGQREKLIFGDELIEKLSDQTMASESRFMSQQEAIDGCLQKLGHSQRELVLRAHAKGVRTDHLAESLGHTPMALDRKLQRIRKILLECVNKRIAMDGPGE